MKYVLLFVASIVLASCSSNKNEPTPFVIDKAIGVPEGCHNLRLEIEKWNKDHPDKSKRVADC